MVIYLRLGTVLGTQTRELLRNVRGIESLELVTPWTQLLYWKISFLVPANDLFGPSAHVSPTLAQKGEKAHASLLHAHPPGIRQLPTSSGLLNFFFSQSDVQGSNTSFTLRHPNLQSSRNSPRPSKNLRVYDVWRS